MNRGHALLHLLGNILKELALSGWATAGVILTRRGDIQPGFARLAYGDLGPGAASLLALLVTLTPGTTSIEIDPDRREILLHLLDGRQATAALASIEDDFVAPLRVLFGDHG